MTGLSRAEKRSSFLAAIAVGMVVMLLAPTVGQAAAAIRIKGKVKIADTNGDAFESEVIPDMGLLQAEGSDGALAVRNYAGGGGFLGAGDCTETTADGRPNSVEATGIVTGIIMTGTDGTIAAQAAAVGPIDLLKFRVTAENPNEFIGLGNGLTATAPITFTCTGTDAEFVILGQ